MKILLGVGNELDRKDDSGVYVAKNFKKLGWLVYDCGPVPENFTGVVAKEKPELVVVVDNAEMGLKPGEFRIIPKEKLNSLTGGTHNMPLKFLAERLEEDAETVIFIGIESNAESRKGEDGVIELLETEIIENFAVL
ncbi:MAG: hydrogenase maturation protease [archaeon]